MSIQVLLVEDDAVAGEAAMRSLRISRLGPFAVRWARGLDEADTAIRAHRPDAVLLDLMLPGTSGLATLATMRQRAPQVPIVVLTGMDGDSAGLEATAMGAADYLRKQEIAYGALPRILRQAVERERLERELRDARVARPLVRRLLTDLLARAPLNPEEMVSVGRALGEDAAVGTVDDLATRFASLGMGALSIRPSGQGRFEIEARDTLERRDDSHAATCHLTLGFLGGALSRLHEGRPVPGAETECQSRGAPCCRFVFQVR